MRTIQCVPCNGQGYMTIRGEDNDCLICLGRGVITLDRTPEDHFIRIRATREAERKAREMGAAINEVLDEAGL